MRSGWRGLWVEIGFLGRRADGAVATHLRSAWRERAESMVRTSVTCSDPVSHLALTSSDETDALK